MLLKEIYILIEECPILSIIQKKYYRENIHIFSNKKKAKIINVLIKAKNINWTLQDYRNFDYDIKLWKRKKQIFFLETNNL